MKEKSTIPPLCSFERHPSYEYEPVDPYVETMIVILQMDRPIDSNIHYISLGGHEFKSGEESVNFDFIKYAGYIDSKDKTKILFQSDILDMESFPKCKYKLTKEFCNNIDDIEEFYVYTGEYDDPELFVSKVLEISLLFSDGSKIDIKPEVIDKFNNELKKGE